MILGPSSPTSLGHPLWGMARRQRDLGRWGSVRLSASSSFLAALGGFRLAGVINSFFGVLRPGQAQTPRSSRFWARPRRPGSRPFMHQVEEGIPALGGSTGSKYSLYCFCQKNNYTF